jgi:hypothetical protein
MDDIVTNAKENERNSVKIILQSNKFIEFQYYLPTKDSIKTHLKDLE